MGMVGQNIKGSALILTGHTNSLAIKKRPLGIMDEEVERFRHAISKVEDLGRKNKT